MQKLRTDILQVGSTDSPSVADDATALASDIGELADLLAEHGLYLAYENWC